MLIMSRYQKIPEQVEDREPAETVEVDELWTFVGKKRSAPM